MINASIPQYYDLIGMRYTLKCNNLIGARNIPLANIVIFDDFRYIKFIYLHCGEEYGPEFFSGPIFNFSFQ